MDKKKNFHDQFAFTSDLILQKKRKNLNLKKETTEGNSFHYLELNNLYESNIRKPYKSYKIIKY